MKVEANTPAAYELIHKGALALARAERAGIRIDIPYCQQQKKVLTKQVTELTKQVTESKFYHRWRHIYGDKTNIDSNNQLSHILYKVMKIEAPKQTESGQGSTDEDTLSQIDIPELKIILEIRKLKKLRDTYLDAFERENYEGYIHPFFNLHTVKTFRSSSDSPNFQNIPKRDKEAMTICRRALYPRPGHQLIEADFSGLEVSISTCYHRDPVMLAYLNNKKSDMHLDMAKQIFIYEVLNKAIPSNYRMRQASKNGFVFPQFYGDWYRNNAVGICEWVQLPQGKWKKGMGMEMEDGSHIADHFISVGIKCFDDFVEHLKGVEDDFWNNRFKVYKQWKDAWVAKYQAKGSFAMFTGFTCSGVMRRNEVINYPVQGAASHCKLWSLIELDRIMLAEKWDTYILGEIHDSILFDVLPEELDHVKDTILRVTCKDLPAAWKWITVPLNVEIDVYDVDAPWVPRDKE